VFSQFLGPGPWYLFLHNSNDDENKLDCLISVFSSPEGDTSLIINDAYDISFVQNVHCVFTAICGGKST